MRPPTIQDQALDIAPEAEMETLFIWIAVIAALIALDAGALLWGVDSRDRMPDDHRR